MAFVSGIAFLGEPKKPFQHLTFQLFSSGSDVRLKISKALKKIFTDHIKQAYGGWISRLPSENAIQGLYEVHLFCRSDDIETDSKFVPLWTFMRDTLEVVIESVFCGLMSDVEADPAFQQKFIIDFSPEKNRSDWSHEPNFNSDTSSIFSVESVDDLK